jgi:hypothetical protein
MIIFQALSGPYVGRKIVDPRVDPLTLLTEFASKDWKWSIDFTQATQDELLEWARADLASRCLAALQHNRAVFFQNTEYRVLEAAQLQEVAVKLEDAIAFSGLMVRVESDTDQGVVIEVVGLESQLQ